MDLQKRLLSAKEPGVILADSNENLFEIIEKLHQYTSLSERVMLPLTAVAQSCGFSFQRITRPILDNLVNELMVSIDKNPEIIPDILEVLHIYIHQSSFFGLFEKIVTKMPSLPDYFLIELIELPLNDFDQIFNSKESKNKIFSQCRPIFHRFVFRVIDAYANDPIKLDYFLNSIRTKIVTKKLSDNGIVPQEFDFLYNLRGQRLSGRHHELCKDYSDELIKLCCENNALYQEVCCIIRDIWEKTNNCLLPALRIELALAYHGDPLGQFSNSIFDFFDNKFFPKDKNQYRPKIDSNDAKFASNDPHLIFLLYCVFLKSVVERITNENYIPFEERDDCKLIVELLAPDDEPDLIEDFSNDIEAYYISLDLTTGGIDIDEIEECLTKEAQSSPRISAIICFCGQQLIERRNNKSKLLEIGLSGNPPPDIILAHVMTKWLADAGLNKNEYASEVLKTLLRWSKENRNILLYFLALLAKRAKIEKDKEIVSQWCVAISDEMFTLEVPEPIEQALLDTIEKTLSAK